MGKLIHIGFGNIVNSAKIIAIVSPDSAPVKRMVQHAKALQLMPHRGEKQRRCL